VNQELPALKRGLKPIDLVKKGTDEVRCYACATCGIVYSKHNKQPAELCCAPKVCEREGCAEETRKYHIYCSACREKADAAKEARKFEAARKVLYADWKGGMLHSDRSDKYFIGWQDYLDECENEEVEPERYLWDCLAMKLHMDAADVIENALSDHHEDANERISDECELQKLLDEWCAKQDVTTFYPSANVVVLAPRKLEGES